MSNTQICKITNDVNEIECRVASAISSLDLILNYASGISIDTANSLWGVKYILESVVEKTSKLEDAVMRCGGSEK